MGFNRPLIWLKACTCGAWLSNARMLNRHLNKGGHMLNKSSIENILTLALEAGDFAEVFCENNARSLITANTEKVETGSMGVEAGVGVRIFQGLNEIYVYTSGPSHNPAPHKL